MSGNSQTNEDEVSRCLARYNNQPVRSYITSLISSIRQTGLEVEQDGTTLRLYMPPKKSGVFGLTRTPRRDIVTISYGVTDGNISGFTVGPYNPTSDEITGLVKKLRS